MRGKDVVIPVGVPICGITPAHAGKRAEKQTTKAKYSDHPRTCGEKHFPATLLHFLWGSPPHMRGKAQTRLFLNGYTGITPAHAGKSTVRYVVLVISQDHPRTCGEKFALCSAPIAFLGSPPHMRGKVGNTAAYSLTTWDHPRTCGEKFFLVESFVENLGSPPHMRGKATAFPLLRP